MTLDLSSASWADVIEGWRSDRGFRAAFTRRLADSEHDAFAWETVPVSSETTARAYEDVLVSSPALARVRPDPDAFEEHFASAQRGVSTFENLGADAVLVSPTPGPDGLAYPHIATFVRSAPEDQSDALWAAVGQALQARLASRPDPVWVSTAGLGVHWLHVRLDDRPKYYRHAPFREFVSPRSSS